MKIEGLGPPPQPDPKGKKPDVDPKKQKLDEKQTSNSDVIDISKVEKQSGQVGYPDDIQKNAISVSSIKKDLSGVYEKTTQGFYDTQQAREKTSEKLIDSRDLKNVVEQYHLSNLSKEILSKSPDIRYEKIAEVKEKIAEGFYDNPVNFQDFADRLIDYFKI